MAKLEKTFLPVTVVNASGCRVALYEGKVYAIAEGLGRCDECAFEADCKLNEDDLSFVAPCSMDCTDECHFVELAPVGKSN